MLGFRSNESLFEICPVICIYLLPKMLLAMFANVPCRDQFKFIKPTLKLPFYGITLYAALCERIRIRFILFQIMVIGIDFSFLFTLNVFCTHTHIYIYSWQIQIQWHFIYTHEHINMQAYSGRIRHKK